MATMLKHKIFSDDKGMWKRRFSLLAADAVPLLAGLLLIFGSLSACSTSDSNAGGGSNFVAGPSLQNSGSEVASAHSPSAMEALSRGMAVVTPPGAPLKDIYYDFDSTDLRDDAQEILKKNADWMKSHPAAKVEIEGHCDDVGSAEYNLALGAKRAQVAKEFLVAQGVASERLVTISYGKEAPACFELTEECREKNRRARFVMFTEVPTS
jgi:peptidoglycan-associated lipoprotein